MLRQALGVFWVAVVTPRSDIMLHTSLESPSKDPFCFFSHQFVFDLHSQPGLIHPRMFCLLSFVFVSATNGSLASKCCKTWNLLFDNVSGFLITTPGHTAIRPSFLTIFGGFLHVCSHVLTKGL